MGEKNNEETSEVENVVEMQGELVQKTELEELEERYKRLLAEFENFKKRSAKERDVLYGSVLSDAIISMLPIVDNLESACKVETKDTNYKQGVDMVLKQFKDILVSKGVEEIKTVGEMFNPEYHEAVGSVQNSECKSQEIVEEYRKGYKVGNKVVRHSMVVVAN